VCEAGCVDCVCVRISCLESPDLSSSRWPARSFLAPCVNVCVLVNDCVACSTMRICVCIRVYGCVYVRAYVCMVAYIYVCAYVCMVAYMCGGCHPVWSVHSVILHAHPHDILFADVFG
jgi:hypothetical protein